MRRVALVLATASVVLVAAAPAPARANPLCDTAGLFSGIAGKVCNGVIHAGKLVKAGKKLLGGHVGGAVATALGGGGGGGGGVGGGGGASSGAGSSGSGASTAIGLAAIGVWVLGGARFALHETGKVLSDTTSPQLGSTWFSSAYWRIAGIAAVLTLPFLFAAAVQALMRSDLALLARAALGYLPLAMLAVSIAAPLTMLLLSASDEMSAIVSSAAGNAGIRFLERASLTIGGLTILSGSPFLAFLVGLLTAAGALVLWLELLMREAAVYVIVLMLPLVFAAFVWPARRVWAIRAVELLVALILSKFAIVAVLALGGAALSHSVGHSVTGFLAGIVLLTMGAFAPWALLRLMPLAELASGAAGSLRRDAREARTAWAIADAGATAAQERWGDDWAGRLMVGMRRQADEASVVEPGRASTEPASEHAGSPAETVVAAASINGADGAAGPAGPTGPHGARGATTDARAAPPEAAPGPDVAPSAWRTSRADAAPNADQIADAGAHPHADDDHDPRPPCQEPEDGRL
jgi:hypothetical protein